MSSSFLFMARHLAHGPLAPAVTDGDTCVGFTWIALGRRFAIELAVLAGLACWFSVMALDVHGWLCAGPGFAGGRVRRRRVMVVLAGAAAHQAGCRGKD